MVNLLKLDTPNKQTKDFNQLFTSENTKKFKKKNPITKTKGEIRR